VELATLVVASGLLILANAKLGPEIAGIVAVDSASVIPSSSREPTSNRSRRCRRILLAADAVAVAAHPTPAGAGIKPWVVRARAAACRLATVDGSETRPARPRPGSRRA